MLKVQKKKKKRRKEWKRYRLHNKIIKIEE